MTEGDVEHREEVARTTRESAIYLASKIVPFLCNLLFIKFYTVYFTPDVIGEYETILALAMMASSLAVGWLQISLLRFYPKSQRENQTDTLVVAISIGFVAAVLLALFIGLILWLLRETAWGRSLYFNLLPWVGVLFLTNCFFILTTTLLRARRFPIRFSVASASYSLFNLSFGFLFALFIGSFLLSLVAGTAVALLIPSLAILLFGRNGSKKVSGENQAWRSRMGPLLAFGLPLSINQAASQILNLSDRYLILILLGDTEAGLYSVVYRIGDFAVRFVILSLMMSAYTSVTETFEHKGREAAERLVSSLTRIYLLLAVPLVVGFWMVQREVVDVLAGSEYLGSAHILGWILLGNFFLGLSQYANFGLHLSHRTMALAGLTLFAAVLNLILNWILLPIYGYPAAAYTTCLSFGFLAVATPFFANRHLSWRVSMVSLARILIATLVFSGVVHLLRFLTESNLVNLVLQASLGAVFYFLALLILGEISWKDIKGIQTPR
ncbi:MAG: polysaccharide biosynthesis C-terminal domain-containing protein [Candidatus Omnitrophica bacterium]|nr:polysaccharide biosynthesis C-terminal domain-containing protein [Candidatus Omnitrophota bacterium]